METDSLSGSRGPSRRVFLSASAVTAVAAPIASLAGPAAAASASTGSPANTGNFDPALRALISQTDPVRGIGAATTWVTQQMQAIADNSNGNMTVQQQTFQQQPVPGRITALTNITNVITTLQGTANPARFYVVTGHLDSRVTDVTDSVSDA